MPKKKKKGTRLHSKQGNRKHRLAWLWQHLSLKTLLVTVLTCGIAKQIAKNWLEYIVDRPAVTVAAWGDLYGPAIPVPPGEQVYPFILRTDDQREIKLTNLRLYSQLSPNLVPKGNPALGVAEDLSEDPNFLAALKFDYGPTISKTISAEGAFRYVAIQSTMPVHLRLTMTAQVITPSIWDYVAKPRPYTVNRDLTLIPSGTPASTPEKPYGLERQPVAKLDRFGEARDLYYTKTIGNPLPPMNCAAVFTDQRGAQRVARIPSPFGAPPPRCELPRRL